MINMIVTSHHTTNFTDTRDILVGAIWYVIFPGPTLALQLTAILEKKLGIAKADVDIIKAQKGARFVAIHKENPCFWIMDNEAHLLDSGVTVQ